MKNITTLIFAAAIAISLTASCKQLEDTAQQGKSEHVNYVFNFTVEGQSNFESLNTRAVKTKWETGDEIFVFFRPTGGQLLTDTYVTLTQNAGGTWDTAVTGESSLGNGGNLYAVFVPYLNGAAPVYKDGNWIIDCADVFYSEAISGYTVSGNNISGSISLEIPEDYVQFYIYGYPDTQERFTLVCNQMKAYRGVKLSSDGNGGYVFNNNETVQGGDDLMIGQKFSDGDAGIVFYGRMNSVAGNCSLTITYGDGSDIDRKTYTRTLNSSLQGLVESQGVRAFKISADPSKWTAVNSKSKTINGHTGYQLWENGPFWAATNIGASTSDATGLYFSWGNVTGVEYKNKKFDPAFTEANYKNSAGAYLAYELKTNIPFDPKYDAAQAAWGGGWRLPTQSELISLSGNSYSTEKTYSSSNKTMTITSSDGKYNITLKGDQGYGDGGSSSGFSAPSDMIGFYFASTYAKALMGDNYGGTTFRFKVGSGNTGQFNNNSIVDFHCGCLIRPVHD